MNLCTKQTGSQTYRRDLWLPRGRGWGRHGLGVWDGRCRLVQTECPTTSPAGSPALQAGALRSEPPGERSVQDKEPHSASCDEPWWTRTWERLYVRWSHCTAQRKLAQTCKSTTLQQNTFLMGKKLIKKFFCVVIPTPCRILAPRPGVEPRPVALEAQSCNYWTTREVPQNPCLFNMKKLSPTCRRAR